VCSLRDAATDFELEGVQVFGISLDSVMDQAKFHEQQSLNFPLLSDPDGSAAKKYGALQKGKSWTNRVTYIIDDKGVLQAIDTEVSVTTHGADLLERVRELRD
jgi:peroxiredoxin Q/BCP